MKRFSYIPSLLFCCLLFYSCIQHETFPDTRNENNAILFETGKVATRGFIENDNLKTIGSQVRIYAYRNGHFLSEDSNPLNGKNLTYGTYNDVNGWNIVDNDATPISYYWEGEGVYRFFGWMAHDAANNLSTPSGWTYDNESQQLTIPTTILNKDYNQYDFLFVEVHERTVNIENMSQQTRKPVPVNMKHLYTAFGIGFKNMSEDPVTITSVAIEGIHDRGTATIDFSGSNSVATYGETSIARDADTPFISCNTSYEVAPDGGQVHNIFNPSDTEKRFYMLWPQAAEVVSPSTPYTGSTEEGREFEATDSILAITYILGGQECERRVKLPTENWEAGKRYYFELQVIDKLLELTATVLPWDYTSTEVDFSQSTVEVKEVNRLKWDESTCTVDHTAQKVYVKNGQPIEATFCIDAPQGGQWRASLEGDVAAFSIIDDTAPTNDGFGPIDGQVHRIRIKPNISSPDRDYTVRLKFVAITADGKTLPADDMIQNTVTPWKDETTDDSGIRR